MNDIPSYTIRYTDRIGDWYAYPSPFGRYEDARDFLRSNVDRFIDQNPMFHIVRKDANGEHVILEIDKETMLSGKT